MRCSSPRSSSSPRPREGRTDGPTSPCGRSTSTLVEERHREIARRPQKAYWDVTLRSGLERRWGEDGRASMAIARRGNVGAGGVHPPLPVAFLAGIRAAPALRPQWKFFTVLVGEDAGQQEGGAIKIQVDPPRRSRPRRRTRRRHRRAASVTRRSVCSSRHARAPIASNTTRNRGLSRSDRWRPREFPVTSTSS